MLKTSFVFWPPPTTTIMLLLHKVCMHVSVLQMKLFCHPYYFMALSTCFSVRFSPQIVSPYLLICKYISHYFLLHCKVSVQVCSWPNVENSVEMLVYHNATALAATVKALSIHWDSCFIAILCDGLVDSTRQQKEIFCECFSPPIKKFFSR